MFRYECKLRQITPMIHFQWNEKGAILRSTEVKPKLDRFILQYIRGKGKDDELVAAITNRIKTEHNGEYSSLINLLNGEKAPEEFDQKQNYSLKYKMRIIAPDNENPIISDTIMTALNNLDRDRNNKINEHNPINGMYFGNMVTGSNEEKRCIIPKAFKETIFYSNSVIKVQIITQSKGLLLLIKKMLPAFFLLHNFGTRQTKGFGSFIVDQELNQQPYNELELIKKYNLFDIIYLLPRNHTEDFSTTIYVQKMDMAKAIYSLIKGGINGRSQNSDYFKGFASIYFLKKGIDNEKRFIKSKFLKTAQVNNPNFMLVRALLGLTEKYNYKYKDGGKEYRPIPKIKVSESSGKIERYPSPLLIKITNQSIYIIPKDNGEDIMGHFFDFNYENKKNQLKIPEANKDFETKKPTFIEDFIFEFALHFPNLRNVVRGTNNRKLSDANYSLRELDEYNLEYVEVNR